MTALVAAAGSARQRWGRHLLTAGFLLGCASLATSIAGGKAGLLLGLVGLALTGDFGTAGRWVWLAGAAATAWACTSIALAGIADGGRLVERSGVLYMWLAFPVAAAAAADPRVRRWGWRLAIAGALAALLLGALQFATGYATDARPFRLSFDGIRHDRISGFFGHHYPFAMVLALIGLAAAVAAGGRSRWAAAGLLALAAVAGVASASRSVLLALPAAIAAGIAARGSRYAMRAALAAAAVLAVLGAGLWLVAPAYLREMAELRNGRAYIWRLTCAEIADHPLLGAGGGARYQAACLARLPERPPEVPADWWFAQGPPHAHNTLLTLAAWYGIPAAVLHLALIAAILFAMRRRGGPEAMRAGVALAVLIEAAGLFDFTIGDAETAAAAFTLLGLLAQGRDDAPA